MRSGRVFVALAVLGGATLAACGGSTAASNPDAGSGSGSGGASGSSGSSSSGGSTMNGSSSGDMGQTGTGPTPGDCPANCPVACCLTSVNGAVTGTCADTASQCPAGGFVPCSAADECSAGTSCCVTLASGGIPSSTACLPQCPAGSPFACGGGGSSDAVDCPNGPVGWDCVPIPGTPSSIFGQCRAVGTSDSGIGAETGTGDASTSDAATAGDGPVD